MFGVGLLVLVLSVAGQGAGPAELEVKVEISSAGELEVGELVEQLASGLGISVRLPGAALRLPARGVGAALTKAFLIKSLGQKARVDFRPTEVVLSILVDPGDAAALQEIAGRIAELATRADLEARRREQYGMHALKSYRPNDPTRPTVCLIHGLNSSSSVFVHFVEPLQQAGYGLVVYDFPYNRDLDESAERFVSDWAEFRRRSGERGPWAIVAHSMGALLARSYVEGDSYLGDVSSLIMLGPVNGGSGLAGAQTLLQMVEGLQAVNGKGRSNPLSQLSDGVGEAADDMMPGSPFLRTLNARPRRDGVAYHILAGNGGLITRAARSQVEARMKLLGRGSGLLGGLTRLATGDLPARLDELTEGTGDGCVAVERTRLAGVSDHVVIPANHLELIRAPLVFPEPGPVVSMPKILEWLSADLPVARR